MSELEVTGLVKRFSAAAAPALDGIDLSVPDGSMTCLLGPSGSGKSTLLSCIAGLIAPDAGRIRIGGRDMAALRTHQRPLTLLMQHAQLFSHLDVVENVEFGLRMRRVDRATRRRRARQLLEIVGLADLERRSPVNLSGGEQQRVALARALAVEPEVLLADEPLASLDAPVRRALQDTLREIQGELGTTIVLVTHDVGEALALADRLVVITDGRVQAHGDPSELVAHPPTLRAAELLGIRNVIWAHRDGNVIRAPFGALAIDHANSLANHSAAVGPRPWVIDATRLQIVSRPGPNTVEATITSTRLLGTTVEVTVDASGTQLAVVTGGPVPSTGTTVCVHVPAEHLVEVATTLGEHQRPGPDRLPACGRPRGG